MAAERRRKPIRDYRRDGTGLNDPAPGIWSVRKIRQQREDLAGGPPKSYFDKYRPYNKRYDPVTDTERPNYDPLKDPNIDAAIRGANEDRRKERSMTLAKSIVHSGGASLIEIGGSKEAFKQYERTRDESTRDAKAEYIDTLKHRLGAATRSFETAKRNMDEFKSKYGLKDLEDTGPSVADRMWNKYKTDRELARARTLKDVRLAGGNDGRDQPAAMGGVQYTGPGNTPFRAGSGSGRKVHEYAEDKAREAREHAMYVAERSAQLKAEREEKAAKGDFIHRNYGKIRAQERLEAEQRRMETLVANKQADAMQVANEAIQNDLEVPDYLKRA